ncbi:MAG: indolepyruvate ferredoxin oxidoreductase subunit alpha [Spirochaetales bacterium]|nr:indolepyruvate ferredoxin oxidoreductase subunit alpha [Spirochaetales bacterium]MCF7938926.1 indolepyruvate ferredoxin oxidoreductase subunit alpha [Spirochaetales bacterium]
MKKQLMSGNQAIALGAWEAGARVGTGYPGTPSTEILENLTTYPDVYTEWSVNEKVALEVGVGSSLTGAKTLVTMKHVGLNVAADPLYTSAYIGVKGGLVIVTADDPALHSSQNEQDNRNVAYAAKLPALEPSDSEEARLFTRRAFEISEEFDTPVLLRSTTRISHSMSVVNPDPAGRPETETPVFERNIKKFVMIPAYARTRHVDLEERLVRLREFAEGFELNRVEPGSKKLGIITSGISYSYAKEAYPDASFLKLGMIHPLPEALIRKFAETVEHLVVVEELDPFFELRIRAMGLEVEGKNLFPLTGELSPDGVARPLEAAGFPSSKSGLEPLDPSKTPLPPRPPQLCPGCPHHFVFQTLRDLGVTVTGDIGCYTLGALPPYLSMDTCVDMGASISVSQGIEIAEDGKSGRKTAAVIGDSTFAHSGLTGLVNAVYNKRHTLNIVLDNGTTAMTGMQPNPLSGERINGEEAFALDYQKLGEGLGIESENIKVVDAYKPDDIKTAVEGLLASERVSLLVVKGTCVILKKRRIKQRRKS